jgi:hypothetical protein
MPLLLPKGGKSRTGEDPDISSRRVIIVHSAADIRGIEPGDYPSSLV